MCVVRASACSMARPSGTNNSAVSRLNFKVLPLLDFGQAGGGDGLTAAPALFVRQLNMNASQLGKFRPEHLVCVIQDDLAAAARSAAPQDEHVLQIVKVRIMGDGIAHIVTHALPYLSSARVTGFQFFLGKLEPVGVGEVAWNLDS